MDGRSNEALTREFATGVTRRSALRRGATATALIGASLKVRPATAQESTPLPVVTAIPWTVGTLFSVATENLPPGPVDITLVRSMAQPGDGDLEDYFTFPGPVAFIVESGQLICRCGTAEDPCMILRSDGTNELAPPAPADIPLSPGEGLFIPANVPDSFTNPGTEPEVELDVTIFPAGAQPSPVATPMA